MGNVMAYSGLTTKIRAMQAKLLTQADYFRFYGCCAGGGIFEDETGLRSLHGSVGTGASSSR